MESQLDLSGHDHLHSNDQQASFNNAKRSRLVSMVSAVVVPVPMHEKVAILAVRERFSKAKHCKTLEAYTARNSSRHALIDQGV